MHICLFEFLPLHFSLSLPLGPGLLVDSPPYDSIVGQDDPENAVSDKVDPSPDSPNRHDEPYGRITSFAYLQLQFLSERTNVLSINKTSCLNLSLMG